MEYTVGIIHGKSIGKSEIVHIGTISARTDRINRGNYRPWISEDMDDGIFRDRT